MKLKHSFLLFLLLSYVSGGYAQISGNDVNNIDSMINIETLIVDGSLNEKHYQEVWSKRVFLNISKNSTTLKSSEYPTTSGMGNVYGAKFENETGVGLQWGQTFDFHKKALGGVVFLGIDYTWIDFNYSSFDSTDNPYYEFTDGKEDVYNLPWHNKKQIFDYGMSVGPSLTLYPFTAIHKNGTDHIRLQFYWHIGYGGALGIIKKVGDDPDDLESKTIFGHGLFSSFGFNLSWKFIGFGYESRRGNKYKFQAFDEEFKTEDPVSNKFNTNRLYLQFRF